MKITKLEYQKKDPSRVNVFVDDKFVAGLDANAILKMGLYRGKEIDDVKNIIDASDFGKLFNKALNFLSFRPRSEWEIRFKFRTEDQETVEKIIAKLKQINQINDLEFAKWFIDQRTTFKPEGKRALKFELKRKGLSDKLIAEVLKDESTTEFELAMRALRKKSKITDPEKLQRFLASRGFSWDTINLALAKIFKKKYNTDS